MEYVIFNPEIHDSKLIAEYRYEVDFRTFDMLFKKPQDAVKTIEKDLRKRKFIFLSFL